MSFKECPESIVIKGLPVATVTLYCDKQANHEGAHHDPDNHVRWKAD